MKKMYLHDLDGKIITSKIPKEAFLGDPLKLIILGDGYPMGKKGQYKNHVTYLIRKISLTPPFNMLRQPQYIRKYAYLNKVMFFSTYSESKNWGPAIIKAPHLEQDKLTPSDHTTLFGLQCDLLDHHISFRVVSNDVTGMWEWDQGILYELIGQLEYTENKQHITGTPTWLNPESNSYGMVVVIAPYPAGFIVGNAIINLGNNPEYFVPCSLTIADNTVEFWPYIALHELGHGFGLVDEYEFSGEQFPPNNLDPFKPPSGITTFEREKNKHILEAENIVFRSQVCNYPALPSNESSELEMNEIDLAHFKWRKMMTEEEMAAIKQRLRGCFTYRDFWDVESGNGNIRKTSVKNLLTGKYIDKPNVRPDFPIPDSELALGAQIESRIWPGYPPIDVWRFPNAHRRNEIQLVEGAIGCQRNVFRSNLECIMRLPYPDPKYNFPPRFCKVCSHVIKRKLKL